MNSKFIIAALVAVFFSACTQDDIQESQTASQELHSVTLKASGAREGTRAVFSESDKSNTPFYWQKNDTIGVLASGSEKLFPLELQTRGENLQSATFSGKINGELGKYAVYPYNANHKISGDTLTYHLPSVYSNYRWDTKLVSSQSAVDDNNRSSNIALWAKITGGDESASAKFKHLGGLLCIQIDKMPATAPYLTVIADRQICGDFKVDLNSSEPKIESTENTVEVPESLKQVTFQAKGTYGSAGVFYIPMPVGEYKIRIKLGYYDISNLETANISSEKTLKIERGQIKIVSSLSESALYKGGYRIRKGTKFVDLGLSVLWAEKNVGATVPADYGYQCAWAEKGEKSYYSTSNYYSYHKITTGSGGSWNGAYNYTTYQTSTQETLSTSDDVAYQKVGSYCRMPTKAEMDELLSGTTQKDTCYINNSGETIRGIEFTSKKYKTSIFLPYNGWGNSSDRRTNGGSNGYYWASTSGDTDGSAKLWFITLETRYYNAYRLFISKDDCNVGEDERCCGMAIRPVSTDR